MSTGRIFQPCWNLLSQAFWTEKLSISNLRMHIAQFKRDYKRELKGRHRATLETALVEILQTILETIRKKIHITIALKI
ncbi:hypothetical protein NSMM_540003 [Nitrosomonas mobilis]|uniref:Uncharacterized protein n=1 Tax=Nitrosomonas mobilis TaxID=51642 RepID=A0A1G5SHR0_9PROT|nr:hypothetical protein NSMM_540003 [Nitrosomonas mobilis]